MTESKLAEALENIVAALEKPENPSLDKPTEFAIAQARGMKIGDAKRIASKALASFHAQQAQPVTTVAARIDSLIDQHGTLRAVSRALGIDVGYLSRLHRGEKSSPEDAVLAKLGLREFRRYELVLAAEKEQKHG